MPPLFQEVLKKETEQCIIIITFLFLSPVIRLSSYTLFIVVELLYSISCDSPVNACVRVKSTPLNV